MLRERVLSMRPTRDHGFRWRSQEVSRLEGLSDAVFGFSITLLVVSLEVPKTYTELAAMYSLAHFVAFAACFAVAGANENPAQPRLELVGIAEAAQIAPAGDERFLGRIGSAIRISQDELGNGVQPIDPQASQL